MKSPGRRTVRKTLADGSVREYTYLRAPKREKPATAPLDSLRALIDAYQRSPEWAALAPRSKLIRELHFGRLLPISDVRVSEWRRRDLLLTRDAFAIRYGPGSANAFVESVGALFGWAVDREWLEHSPASRIKSIKSGAYPTWTEMDLKRALEKFSEPARRAVVLAVHTGQRRGDLIRLRWSDIAGGTLRVVQEKTGVSLTLPLHPTLKRELAAWRKGATADTILTDADGEAWRNREHLTYRIIRERRAAKMPEGLNLHGLRKLAATRLAEAGCSAHEIAAWTGHLTLTEVEVYTRAADQRRLAGSGMDRLSVVKVSTGKKRKTT